MQDRRSHALSVLFAVLLVAVALARYTAILFDKFVAGKLPNPDSYYNMVLLLDGWRQGLFPFEPRDNAPFGSWVHWTLPYSWTLWQAHWPFVWMGFDARHALLYGGGALTLLCMLLLALFVALAVLQAGSRRAAMVSGLVLATSMPLLSYGRVDQITHHIFMLLPLAAAAACLLGVRSSNLPRDLLGGMMLGLALWITPETMPFVVGLLYLRMATRAQYPESAAIWPAALGLVLLAVLAWWLDPPPPTFPAWALARMSLAWVFLAALLAGIGLFAEALVARGFRLLTVVAAVFVVSVAAAVVWLYTVPGALNGPAGLIPPELRTLWWSDIEELRPVRDSASWVGWVGMPAAGAVLGGILAWKRRCLWLAGLAFMSLCYGALAVWHGRMGAAASVAATLAFCVAAGQLHAFSDDDAGITRREQTMGFFLTILAVLQIMAFAGLAALYPSKQHNINCSLASVAGALNQLPPATILTGVFSGPELLYRTHHRVIAGPYQHNVSGMVDDYNAWLDTGGGSARAVITRRHVGYVLGCTDIETKLTGKPDKPTLAQRVASGDVPDWLKPVPWPKGTDTKWRLYRVVPVDTSGTK